MEIFHKVQNGEDVYPPKKEETEKNGEDSDVSDTAENPAMEDGVVLKDSLFEQEIHAKAETTSAEENEAEADRDIPAEQ